jgi:hypothetical protein
MESNCSRLSIAAACAQHSHMQAALNTPHAATCNHMQPHAANPQHSNLQPHAATCSHMQPHAATCSQRSTQPHAATCSHTQPHAASSQGSTNSPHKAACCDSSRVSMTITLTFFGTLTLSMGTLTLWNPDSLYGSLTVSMEA